MRIMLASLLVSLVAPLSPLQAAPTGATQQPGFNGRRVASEVSRLLEGQYVISELRPKFAAVLSTSISSGRYDVSSPAELVNRLNEDLGTVTSDKHLAVMYDPVTSRDLAEAPKRADADDPPPTASEIVAARRRNHGLVQMKVLAGNIRYLETDGFVWAGEPTERAYDNAMAFLSDGDAVIIDMRKNGGGSPDAVRYLVSHFTTPNRPLMTFYMGSNRVDTTTTLANLRAPRMVGKPLYILTSNGSASAAEEFIGHVAGYKLGEIIGQPTAGAGFRNEFFGLPDGMIISISVGRAVLASTGKDWEGVGITPTTKVDADKALQVAEAHALRRIAQTASPERKAGLEAAAVLYAAQAEPVQTALPLAAYAGAFGDRTIAVESGQLTFQRQGAPKHNLVAIDPSQFVFEDDPMSRVRFTGAGGTATEFELLRSDGTTAKAVRSQ